MALASSTMALASRLFSKSNQLYARHILLQPEHVVTLRYFSKEADPPALKGDEMLKNIFLEVKNKFETAILVPKKEKITINPDDPAAVEHYEKVMKTVGEKRGLTDELAVEAMMMEALENVEKEIKKPLMHNDKKGMAILMAEFDKINKKYNWRKFIGDRAVRGVVPECKANKVKSCYVHLSTKEWLIDVP